MLSATIAQICFEGPRARRLQSTVIEERAGLRSRLFGIYRCSGNCHILLSTMNRERRTLPTIPMVNQYLPSGTVVVTAPLEQKPAQASHNYGSTSATDPLAKRPNAHTPGARRGLDDPRTTGPGWPANQEWQMKTHEAVRGANSALYVLF